MTLPLILASAFFRLQLRSIFGYHPFKRVANSLIDLVVNNQIPWKVRFKGIEDCGTFEGTLSGGTKGTLSGGTEDTLSVRSAKLSFM